MIARRSSENDQRIPPARADRYRANHRTLCRAASCRLNYRETMSCEYAAEICLPDIKTAIGCRRRHGNAIDRLRDFEADCGIGRESYKLRRCPERHRRRGCSRNGQLRLQNIGRFLRDLDDPAVLNDAIPKFSYVTQCHCDFPFERMLPQLPSDAIRVRPRRRALRARRAFSACPCCAPRSCADAP